MKALLVEDDAILARQLAEAFGDAGFATDQAANGEDAAHLGATGDYDIVVLDLGLPKGDGLSVLRAWREGGRTMPVLILTARDGWSDKVSGFRAGADDYALKSFRMEEIVMRARALVRRAAGHAAPLIRCGPLVYDTQLAVVTLDGLPLKLTAYEQRILIYLLHHAERPVSRTEISEHIYASDAEGDFNTLEVLISRLRKKIGAGLIETVRGQGYRLTAAGTGDALA